MLLIQALFKNENFCFSLRHALKFFSKNIVIFKYILNFVNRMFKSFSNELDSAAVAKRLKALREQARLSQTELANRLGLKHAASVSIFEKGTIPTVPVLAKLCDLYGLSPNEILYGTEEGIVPLRTAPEPALQLWDVYVGLENRDRDLIRVEMGLLQGGSREARDAIRSSMKLIFQAFRGEIKALPI